MDVVNSDMTRAFDYGEDGRETAIEDFLYAMRKMEKTFEKPAISGNRDLVKCLIIRQITRS